MSKKVHSSIWKTFSKNQVKKRYFEFKYSSQLIVNEGENALEVF